MHPSGHGEWCKAQNMEERKRFDLLGAHYAHHTCGPKLMRLLGVTTVGGPNMSRRVYAFTQLTYALEVTY